jgi:hypothetical protein
LYDLVANGIHAESIPEFQWAIGFAKIANHGACGLAGRCAQWSLSAMPRRALKLRERKVIRALDPLVIDKKTVDLTV